MTLLHLLAYAGGLAAFLFVTLSLASGLLWLAELIEEHSKHAKYVGIRAIYAIISLHVLLWFTDSLPFLPLLFSIGCHLVYLTNFSAQWPYISLTSKKFILSCFLVIGDHFIWFFHFANLAQENKKFKTSSQRYHYNKNYRNSNNNNNGPSFGDVAAFFAICVWFIPLFLFLSLSANDNALPSLNTLASGPASPSANPNSVDLSSPGFSAPGSSSPTHRQMRRGSSTSLVKSVLNPLLSLLPRVRRNVRKNEEGIIAPRTPIRGSPLHSPVLMPSSSRSNSNANSYFPWASSDDSATANISNLNLNHNHNLGVSGIGNGSPSSRSTTPPPPRRIQSEIQISKNTHVPTPNNNPRGIATRNGRPALNGQIPADVGQAEIIEAPKRSSPLSAGAERAKGNEGLTRRKAD
ncbi:uncharacterized protein I303_100163 [Kwoniella dejecticola CBS 10117]|uniref:Endoplasmic reticulum protein n=1 Tax=Kwoniella dejecticola CBS 10117 TaxID=1296121 RepID=A0A1A6AE51_9TREE|nr:uncharacterized protein I303_00165 [Kwoniella dejecticola CBS 10117]OBR88352.1 hypothetical protein I303_00165 [Kwoniella dejecticola CBS 10117]